MSKFNQKLSLNCSVLASLYECAQVSANLYSSEAFRTTLGIVGNPVVA